MHNLSDLCIEICQRSDFYFRERMGVMPQTDWITEEKRDRKKETPKKKMPVQAVQAIICAVLVLSVWGLGKSETALYTALKAAFQNSMQEDLNRQDVWTATKGVVRSVLEPVPSAQTESSTQATAVIDERAEIETIAGTGGEDIRILDALENSTFRAVTVSKKAVVPVQGKVTSGFGYRIHPITGNRSFHTGIDIAAPEGTQIAAAYGGTVEKTGYTNGRGNYILLRHGDNLQTMYCHLSSVDVKKGELVTAGGQIGKVGTTGMSTGPHLHFELRVDGIRCNPVYILEGLQYA